MLTAAIGLSQASTAHTLIEILHQQLRRKNPTLAWECYMDLSSKSLLGYISSEQYKNLIRLFGHLLGKSNSLEYVLTLIEDMQKMGWEIETKQKLLVLRLLAGRGKMKEMHNLLSDLDRSISKTDPDAHKSYNIVLAAYHEHSVLLGRQEAARFSLAALSMLEKKGLVPPSSTAYIFMDVIRLCTDDAEIVDLVWNFFETKADESWGVFYKGLILFFSAAGRPDYGLLINDRMKMLNIPRDTRVMTALIHKVGRGGNIPKAMELLEEMKDCGIEPNVVTLNALVDIHVHKHPTPDIIGAFECYGKLTASGIQPNTITYDTLIDMFARKGDGERIKELFTEMTTVGLRPSQHTFSSLIKCFMVNKDYSYALKVLHIMSETKENTPPSTAVFNLLINSFIGERDIVTATALLTMMKKSNVKTDLASYTPFMMYYANKGEVKDCLAVAEIINKRNLQPDPHTLTILLKAYAVAYDIEGTEEMYRQFKKRWRPNIYVFNTLMYAYVIKDDLDMVLNTYKSMLQTNVKMSIESFGLLMYSYSRRGEPEAMEALMNTMKFHDLQPSLVCWNLLLQAYFTNEEPEKAKEVMNRMAKEGISHNHAILGTFVNGLVKSDNFDTAKSVVDSAIERAQQSTPTSSTHLVDLTFMSDAAYTDSIPLTIEDMLSSTTPTHKNSLTPHLFTPLISGYIAQKRIEEAKGVYRQMCSLGVLPSIKTYISVMRIYLEAEDHNRLEILWNALLSQSNSEPALSSQPTCELDLDPALGPVYIPTLGNKRVLSHSDEEDALHSLLVSDPSEILVDERQWVPRFALSIYMKSLLLQNRTQEIDTLWKEFDAKGYLFDVHNWNTYVISLIQSKRFKEACQITKNRVLEASEEMIKSSKRKRELYRHGSTRLFNTTYHAFAEVFQIPISESINTEAYRRSIEERIKNYMGDPEPTFQELSEGETKTFQHD
ncbi:hypothetical protein BDF14DRAFT_1484607 [Spinellus fusiger]|nr:hypothetical protein BDF14DRAFT_1484607 [Spinellus fusiger]